MTIILFNVANSQFLLGVLFTVSSFKNTTEVKLIIILFKCSYKIVTVVLYSRLYISREMEYIFQ